MLTSAELQKLSEEAEAQAKEARRANYVNEHVHKPKTQPARYKELYDNFTWLYKAILIGIGVYGVILQPDFIVVIGLAMWCVIEGLSATIDWILSWRPNRYQKKVRKAEAEFNELVRKENLEFHVTDWDYYRNS